ncbi:hypothetical protein Drorol1_Dr00016015 [Drosera rotundifolia]
MALKYVNRPAMVAMSPESPYLAAGTAAGQVDESFSTSSHLEIFKLDFKSDDRELVRLGGCVSSQRFYRLSWGKCGEGDEGGEFGDGLIAGGFNEGSVGIWNPRAILSSEEGVDPLVCLLSGHKGEVHGLEFNSLSPYHLASGADDGEIYIWNLNKPKEPAQFPVLKGTGSAAQGQISYLSWNSKVQHILASTSLNGTTVVWDLKKQKPVISFSDSTRRKCSVLQWNPDVATQIVVASDDDSSPSFKLWDMRNIMQPVREFMGHTKGVLSLSWCPIDSSFLVSSGKDNRTICWDTNSGEMVCELPTGSNSSFDIHWYRKIPGIISASSYEGIIGLYNTEAFSRYGVGEADFGAAPLRAPKWYRRPVGVSFGFGGKLVSFHSKSSPAGSSVGSSEVYVHSIVTEGSLVNRSSEFEAAIRDRERASLKVFCQRKYQEAESEVDKETWSLLKVMFEDVGEARTNVLTHLGFSKPEEAKDTYEEDLSQQVNGISLDNIPDKAPYREDNGTPTLSFDNGEDFFNNLPSPKADTPVSTSGNNFAAAEIVPVQDQAEAGLAGEDEDSDPAVDDAVQRALVVGDYKTAVTLCIAANRLADALVISHFGGASLWESTRQQFFKRAHSPYLKVLSAMVNNDLMTLVSKRPVKSWKETMALICAFAQQREEWTLLCDTLASKLLVSGNTLAATLCYICAGNVEKTMEIWSQGLSAEPEGKSYVDSLQDLMEKTIVFALTTEQKPFSPSLHKLVEKYVEILASQGLLSTAMGYLKLLGEDLSPELVILRDRISSFTESVNELRGDSLDYGYDETTAATRAQRSYYTDTTQGQLQTPSNPFAGQYQPSLNPYGGNYAAPPASYQPVPQPQIFVPFQSPQAPQMNFGPPPVVNQPAVRPFTPTPPTPLRDADKYQQPSTLAAQLYSGSANLPNQQGPSGSLGPMTTPPSFVPSQTPAARGFMPVSTPVLPHRSTPSSPTHLGGMQPASVQQFPVQQSPLQPAMAAQAPPPTVQTVDTSNVPAHLKPAIATLTRLFHETSEAFGGSRAGAQKRREIDDNSKKLGSLFDKLNKRDISNNVSDKLVQLCQALDKGDYGAALHIQVQLTTSDWDECNSWLAALKRMIKVRQSVRL